MKKGAVSYDTAPFFFAKSWLKNALTHIPVNRNEMTGTAQQGEDMK
jgi:hypothetical protein